MTHANANTGGSLRNHKIRARNGKAITLAEVRKPLAVNKPAVANRMETTQIHLGKGLFATRLVAAAADRPRQPHAMWLFSPDDLGTNDFIAVLAVSGILFLVFHKRSLREDFAPRRAETS